MYKKLNSQIYETYYAKQIPSKPMKAGKDKVKTAYDKEEDRHATRFATAINSQSSYMYDMINSKVDKSMLKLSMKILNDKNVKNALSESLNKWVDDYITTRFGTNEEIKSELVDVGTRIVKRVLYGVLGGIIGSEGYTAATSSPNNSNLNKVSDSVGGHLSKRLDSSMDSVINKFTNSLDGMLDKITPNIKDNVIKSIKESEKVYDEILHKMADDVLDNRLMPLIKEAEDVGVKSAIKAIKEVLDDLKKAILKDIGYYDMKDEVMLQGDEWEKVAVKQFDDLMATGDENTWKTAVGSMLKTFEDKKAIKAAKAVSRGVSSAARSVRNFFSDPRLKYDIKFIGKSPSGINIYTYKLHDYMGQSFPGVYSGVLSDEVPWATFTDENGYEMVDYDKIDVTFKKII